jgi:hypothetical protein
VPVSANDAESWRRLGELLTRRRIELGYRSRPSFVAARGLSHGRIVSDLETGARSNYDLAPLMEYEIAYHWQPGSIGAVLAGGEPRPADSSDPVGPAPQDGGVLLSLPSDAFADLTDAEREEAIAIGKAAILERAREIRRRLDS